jgi:wobble nucleotide-excising tRNase
MTRIQTIQHVRSVGKFELVNSGAQLPFAKLALVYAENGRGKTTLAAILRSLSGGGSTLVLERRRLGAKQPPHIVIKPGNLPPFVFEKGTWSS